jgi:hypothetical protein
MSTPGVSRENRISDEGLNRLRKHLQSGPKMSKTVLDQWVKRYGDEAVKVLQEFGINYTP